MPYFCLYCAILLSLHLPHATSISFNLNLSQPGAYNADDFSFQGDAFFDAHMIQLTTNDFSKGINGSVGRVSYAQPVPLWDNVTGELASFTTTFSFQIKRDYINKVPSGDGMAFFLGHYPSRIPLIADGERLGLFNQSVATNATGDDRAVAVELDTFLNDGFDTSNNHMGIDVNSLISQAYTNTTVPGKNLTSGLVMTCRASYDNGTKNFAADLQIGDASYHVDTTVDLRQVLPSVVAIGFSGATGRAVELHQVLSWSFNSTLDGPQPPAATKVSKFPWKLVLMVAVPIIGSIVLLFCVFVGFRRCSQKNKRDETLANVPRRFDYAELVSATNNFAEDMKLGKGCSASVYRGQLRNPEKSVAIKRFNREETAMGTLAFEAEVKVISRVRHRNLVELVGWCNHNNTNRLLVYEFMSEGSLDDHLHEGRSWLSWRQRYKIILDLGRALQYLHEQCNECILHGDIKPCNILLDSRYVAKLADFGLARLIDHETEPRATEFVVATLAYLDPQFKKTGKRSKGSDVYSFGIVLLEIVSGQRPDVLDSQDMVTRFISSVWDNHRSDAILEAAERRLLDESKRTTSDDKGQMKRVLLVGLWCAHPDPSKRPPIKEAMKTLQSVGEDVEIPPLRPGEGSSSSSANSNGVHPSIAGRPDDQDLEAR